MTAREAWRDSMQPRIEAARVQLQQMPLETLAHRSGTSMLAGKLHLKLLCIDLVVEAPSFEVTADGVPCAEETQMLVLDYLLRCADKGDRPDRSTEWIGFSELPDGAFYAKAFRSYTTDLLVKEMDGQGQWLQDAARLLGAKTVDMGDFGVSFQVLPTVKLAIIWWAGDDEFPASANLLFDPDSLDVLPIDGYAALGRMLCRQLIRIAQVDESPRSTTSTEGSDEGDLPSLKNAKEEPCPKS